MVKLFKLIDDEDFYIISRKINKNIIDEWIKTIHLLQSNENDYPIEISYLNNQFQNKIKNYINDIIKKYKVFYEIEINKIKNEYNILKENIIKKNLCIVYRLDNTREDIKKEDIMINIMITISNNLWNKEDKNIFFISFDDSDSAYTSVNKHMIGTSIIDNFYETNNIENINIIDYKEEDKINKCEIKYKNQIHKKIYKCVIITWDEFNNFRNSFIINKNINNKFIISYDKYEDPSIKILYNNKTLDDLYKTSATEYNEKINEFKNITNNLTNFDDNDNIIIDKRSFINNFVNIELINKKITNLLKDYDFENKLYYEINDSEYLENDDDDIDIKLSSLKLISKL